MKVGINTAELEYHEFRKRLRSLSNAMQSRRPLFDSDMSADVLRVCIVELRNRRVRIAELWQSSGPGMQTVARRLRNDPAYDMGAEVTTVNGVFNTLMAELLAAVPKDGSGNWSIVTYDSQGFPTWTTVPVSELADVRAAIDALIAEIDFEGT